MPNPVLFLLPVYILLAKVPFERSSKVSEVEAPSEEYVARDISDFDGTADYQQ